MTANLINSATLQVLAGWRVVHREYSASGARVVELMVLNPYGGGAVYRRATMSAHVERIVLNFEALA